MYKSGDTGIFLEALSRENQNQSLGKSSQAKSEYEGAVDNLYNRPLHKANDPDVDPVPVKLIVTNDLEKACSYEISLYALNSDGLPIDWTYETVVTFNENEKSRKSIIE